MSNVTSRFSFVPVPGLPAHRVDIESGTQHVLFELDCATRPHSARPILRHPPGRVWLRFASVTNAFLGMTGKYDRNFEKDVLDEKTGVRHPSEVCDLESCRCAQLLGVGPRSKKLGGLITVDVYSLGLYANIDHVREVLQGHQGKSKLQLGKDQQFLADFKRPEIEKELRMIITFGSITKEKFWNAMSDGLGPRLQKANASAVLHDFRTHFDKIKFHKGTEIRLAMSKDGTVRTLVDHDETGTIKSPALSEALIDLYLGSEPPSKMAKEDLLTSVSAILSEP